MKDIGNWVDFGGYYYWTSFPSCISRYKKMEPGSSFTGD